MVIPMFSNMASLRTTVPCRSFFTSSWRLQRNDRRRRSCPVALTEKDTRPEYWETPQYPPIVDPSREAEKLRDVQKQRDWITSLPTVEEKLFHLMDDRVWKGFKLRALPNRYNTLPLIQHSTRTHVAQGLPLVYGDTAAEVDKHYGGLKDALVESVEIALRSIANRSPDAPVLSAVEEERRKTKTIVWNVLRTLVAGLGATHPHIQTAQIDEDPRCEASWHCGGFALKPKEEKDYPPLDRKDQLFFYEHMPLFNVRTLEPLEPFKSTEDDLCRNGEVVNVPYDPEYYGLEAADRFPTLLPGCWPSKTSGFGHMSFHSLEGILERRKDIGVVDEESCITEYGLLASFAWLMGMAAHQGFTPVSELTYPFSTQTVITDGQKWSFFAYQLNTSVLCGDVQANPLRNLCWESQPMKLYDTVEDGKLKGVNDEVFKLMIQCLTRVPDAKGLELQPYLREVEHPQEYLNQMGHWLWRQYDQRRSRNEYETYQWEEIYLFKDAYVSVNERRQRRKRMPFNIPDDFRIRLQFPKLCGPSRRRY